MKRSTANKKPNATKEIHFHVPTPQRERIMKKFISGEGIRKISRDEHRSRGTVSRIVNSGEVQGYVQNLRAEYYGLGAEALLEERKQRRRPHILTFDEQAKLLVAARPHLRLLVVLITETGLRVGKEALPLKWKDVDLTNDVVRVHDSKTLAGLREVPLSAFCKTELLRWKQLTGPDFSPYVFFNPGKPSTNLQSVRKVWTSALKKASLAPFHIYDLRATFASRLSAAGVPDVFVSQMMGHAGGLLQTYSKAIVEYRRDAIRKLEELRQSHLDPAQDQQISTVQ
jgi:integrase